MSRNRTSGKKATRPCVCGWFGDPSGRCRCTPDQVARYRGRLSGPLLDRIELAIDVPAPPADALALDAASTPLPETPDLKRCIALARERQRARQGITNARLDAPGVARHCALDRAAQALLTQALVRMALSARAYHRIAKVARTIADIAGSDTIESAHVAEAIGYRRFDVRDRH